MKYHLTTCKFTLGVDDIDRQAVEELFRNKKKFDSGSNKIIEFGYWEGETQGPLVAWTIKGKEKIGGGLWQQVEGNTDLTPWLVSSRGPVYSSFKKHYESLIRKAKDRGKLYSSLSELSMPNKANSADVKKHATD